MKSCDNICATLFLNNLLFLHFKLKWNTQIVKCINYKLSEISHYNSPLKILTRHTRVNFSVFQRPDFMVCHTLGTQSAGTHFLKFIGRDEI
jgi:hypothetical protein